MSTQHKETMMRKSSWLPVVAALSVLTPLALIGSSANVFAQDAAGSEVKAAVKPAEAKTIMDAAYRKAKAERKPILVMFHATW